MGLFDFFKRSSAKQYSVPYGKEPKDHAQSILYKIEYHCEEINKSTTVFEFYYSYEKLTELIDELIWLNEKKHVSMSPSPRSSWSEIQQNIPQAINKFLERALHAAPDTGEDRAEAIEVLLNDIAQNEAFQHIFNQENNARVEDLRNEAKQIRNLIQETSRQQISTPPSHSLFAYYGGPDAALLDIDLMEGHDFEAWCAGALKNLGFCDVTITPPSGDHGVDVLAKKDGIKYAIQCKRYSSDLGNKPIQEVHAGKALYHCHVGVVITNQHFTAGARTLAEATDTLLWDRDWIINYLRTHYASTHITAADASAVANQTSEEMRCANEGDEMLPAAVDVILKTGQASVSMIQRHLKLGYARAARIIDEMEEKGLVGPFQGSKPRDILITKEQWYKIRPQ